jgi:hypothetical protein
MMNEHGLRAFESRVLRTVFGSVRERERGSGRSLE